MKVLLLGNDPSVKGGITSVISQLLAYDWSTEDIEMKFIPTYVEATKAKKLFFFAKAYVKIKKEFICNRPDVVHIHMSYKGSFTRKYFIHKLCMKYDIPDIVHLHGSEFKKWFDKSSNVKKSKIRSLLKESAACIVLGEKWNRIIKEIEPETNTVVVSNTVHIPDCTVEWNQPFKVLFMGVLIKRKGVSDLLNATFLLMAEGKLRNTKIVIAGSGPEEEALKTQCCQLGLGSYVEFVGWIPGEKKEKLFRECQMLVLPSYNEGLPIAVLEAASYGMPIVATNVGDISSAVLNGKNGYLVKPGDTYALADAISKCFTDIEIYTKMSHQSKMIAKCHFSDEKYFAQLVRCYRLCK